MFIEWLASSCFSFLEGVSQPDDLVAEADSLGYAGLGLGDRMGLYGLARGHKATREAQARRPDFFFAPGLRLHFDVADPLFVYPCHRRAHGDLCRFLSTWALEGMVHREKGLTPLRWRDFLGFLRGRAKLSEDFILVSVSGRFYPWVSAPDLKEDSRVAAQEATPVGPSFSTPPRQGNQCPFWLLELAEACGRGPDSALSLAFPLTFAPGVEELHSWLQARSLDLGIPLLATTLPLFVSRDDYELCQLVTAIRHGRRLDDLGYLAQANAERRLLSREELRRAKAVFLSRFETPELRPLLRQDPFERSLRLRERVRFSLDELRYRYPRESVPSGETPSSWLRKLTFEGALTRYPQPLPAKVTRQLEHELELIARLGYEDYFLTIWEVLRYAREKNILFQGRGSAANSAVCYCLGITAVDPERIDLLFERFLSMERAEPPDIDVDFEHERREEVLQEIYRRYGRERAAMMSSTICFRGRMAVRETAKALGFKPEAIDAIVRYMGREGLSRLAIEDPPQDLKLRLREHGIGRLRWARLLRLAPRLVGLPRHMGLHTGGFVLSDEPLVEQCVLEPARMENRSVVPWDKNDIDALGWMKVDFLSLGILTALRKCFELVGSRNETRAPLSLASVPAEDPRVYRSLCRGDTVGVFQIESRAQMNMLPRLAPQNFYDLVIEIAIVRPGPLQGGMVHPYLQRRLEKRKNIPRSWRYDHAALEPVLQKTLGVPIFQEQVMKMATAIGGFTPGEADQLRKVMSGTWRSVSRMHKLKDKLIAGMKANGLSNECCARIYRQIEGFGEYGFPESHSASFAILCYASAWLKLHHPAEFLCALLNSQPMGFYAPRALVSDAERHGVRVLPPDITRSRWDSTLELADSSKMPAVRLGLRLLDGFPEKEARLIEKLQQEGFLTAHERGLDFEGLRWKGLSQRGLEILIRAGACSSLGSRATHAERRDQSWQAMPLRRLGRVSEAGAERAYQPELALRPHSAAELPAATPWESLLQDYRSLGLSPGRHPIPFVREAIGAPSARPGLKRPERFWTTAEDVYRKPDRARISIVGLLSVKQKPPTAGGMCFLTLEDETGFFNLALRAPEYEAFRLLLQEHAVLAATGRLQRSETLDPRDPHTSAVSLLVESLWNPLVGNSAEKQFSKRIREFR